MKAILMCGDLSKNLDELMEGRKADLIYSDLPWDVGKITYFYRIAGVHTRPELYTFFVKVADAIRNHAKDAFYIEMGKRNLNMFLGVLANKHIAVHEVYPIVYGHPERDMWLIYGGLSPVTKPILPSEHFHPLRSIDIPVAAIIASTNEGDAVLDFCTGRGMLLKACHKTNRDFYGMELSRERLDYAIEYAKKHNIDLEVL